MTIWQLALTARSLLPSVSRTNYDESCFVDWRKYLSIQRSDLERTLLKPRLQLELNKHKINITRGRLSEKAAWRPTSWPPDKKKQEKNI